jgi:2-C-methyl-D-erythritol 4-phosphate cytidylyltransferase
VSLGPVALNSGRLHCVSAAMIVLAGGSGSRMDPTVNKVYLTMAGRSILAFSLDTLERAPMVERIVLVTRPDDRARADSALAEAGLTKPCAIVDGGATRQESEMAGLENLAPAIESGEVHLVAIHDGARPFASLQLIESLFNEARRLGGAIPAVTVEETLYGTSDGYAQAVLTGSLVRVQTPQAFAAPPLLAAYRSAALVGYSGFDTAETMERFSNVPVGVVEGDVHNIKITVFDDIAIGEDLARRWEEGRWK